MRIRSLSVVTSIAVSISLAVGTALCTIVPSASAGTDNAMLGAPAVGQCYAMSGRTAANLMSAKADPTRCNKRHTLWITGVFEVPEGVAMETGDKKFEALYVASCLRANREAAKATKTGFALSAYATYRFVPTKAQQAQGARWLSCELGIHAGGSRLVSRAGALPPVGSNPAKPIRLCWTASITRTNCASTHRYAPTYVHLVTVGGSVIDPLAQRICARRMHGDQTYVYAWTRVAASRTPAKAVYGVTCFDD